MSPKELDDLRLELSVKAKNGINFIIAASLVWTLIAYIWTLAYSSYDRSVLTFIAGAILLQLAYGLGKAMKVQWKIKNNPLEPLGLWLNFSQLFYFPVLVFMLLKYPDYFLMTYAIITGAHFFPYTWFYKELGYAVMAGVISIGSFFIALNISANDIYLIALVVAICLVIQALWLHISYKKKVAS